MNKGIIFIVIALTIMFPAMSFATSGQVIATNSPTTSFYNYSAPTGQYINKISGTWSAGIGYIFVYTNYNQVDTIMITQDPQIYFSTATAAVGDHITKVGPDGANYFHAWSESGSLSDIILNFGSNYTWTFSTFTAPSCEVITGFTASTSSGWDYLYAVSTPLAIIVNGGGTYCDTTTLTASGGLGGTIYWQDTISGGTSTVLATTSQVVTSSGTYFFREYNTCGWGIQDSAIVIIDTSLIPSSVIVSGGGLFCDSATLTASGGLGGTIYWQGTISGGTSTTTPSISQTVTTSGTYYFRAFNNCAWGLEDSATVSIDTTFPTGVTLSASQTEYCVGDSIFLTGSALGATMWNWTSTGGFSSILQNPKLIAVQKDTFSLVASNICGSSPVQSISVGVHIVDTLVHKQGITLVANTVGAGYQWINCNDSLPISGETNQSFTAMVNGNYAVIITENTCIDTSLCHSIISVGLNENNYLNEISIYPNPSNGNFTFNYVNNKQENVTIQVFDVSGSLIYKVTTNDYIINKDINLSEEGNGVYVLKLTTNEHFVIKKLVKM